MVLLKTSRTSARTRSLVASSAIWSAVTCHRFFLLSEKTFGKRQRVAALQRLGKRVVSQVEQSTRVRGHLPISHSEVYAANVNPAFAYLENDRIVSGRRLTHHRGFHKGV